MTANADSLPPELDRDMEACQRLAGELDGEDEADLDALQREVDELIAEEKGPVAELRARATGQRIAIVVAAVTLLSIGVALGTPRADLGTYPLLRTVLVLALLGALTAVATWRLLRPLHLPRPSVTSSRLLLVAGLLAPFVISIIPVNDHTGAAPGEGVAFATACFKCFGFGGALGLPVLGLAFVMRRAQVDGAAVAALAGVVAGLMGNLALHLHCPVVDPLHLIIGHALLVVVFSIAAAAWRPREARVSRS
jgi:hypothetical protein